MCRFAAAVLFGFIVIVTGFAAGAAETELSFPSFPCEYATLTVEGDICRDPQLRRFDWELDDSYRRARISRQGDRSLIEEQAVWLASRNECGTHSCVADHYRTRITKLLRYAESSISDSEDRYLRPSYNCQKARPGVEETICASKLLSRLDWKISDVYQRARIVKYFDRKELRRAQNSWIRSRNACEDFSCIVQHYNDRIGVLEGYYPSKSMADVSPRQSRPSNVKPSASSRLSPEEHEIVEKLLFNSAKCIAKKFLTDAFKTPEQKAVVGAAVTTFFDGEAPPAGKVAGGYVVDKLRQWLKENGQEELANLLGHAKTADCIMRGVFY